jgi:ABC-type transporter lipoprotein component MlaA
VIRPVVHGYTEVHPAADPQMVSNFFNNIET